MPVHIAIHAAQPTQQFEGSAYTPIAIAWARAQASQPMMPGVRISYGEESEYTRTLSAPLSPSFPSDPSESDLFAALLEAHARLTDSAVELDDESRRILYENLWSLYL